MAENQNATTAIEARIDRGLAGAIDLKTTGGMQVTDVGQAMEVAKLMSISGSAVPAHVRNNPGTCLAVAIQAWEWSMNPFAVANKSYVVNDRLAYESALYNAVVTRRAPIVGRLKIAYEGEGPTRRCTVSATLQELAGGGEVDYTSPRFADINPKNSPLWKNDPDQQLFYFSVRAFTRRHFPDVMMGVYTVDEMQDAPDAPAMPPRRQVASIDVSATLGRATEKTTQPGGTAATAPQPRDAHAAPTPAQGEPEAPKPPAAPTSTRKPRGATRADLQAAGDADEAAAKPETAPEAPAPSPDAPPPSPTAPAADATADLVAKVKAAWSKRLQTIKGWDEAPDADIVDAQIENFCIAHWAKMSLADVAAKKPSWLKNLLDFIDNSRIPPERFDFGIQEAPTDDAPPARPNRPGRKTT